MAKKNATPPLAEDAADLAAAATPEQNGPTVEETQAAKIEASEKIIAKQAETIKKMEAKAAKTAKELVAAKAKNIPTEKVKDKPAAKPKVPSKPFEVDGEKYKFKVPRFSVNIGGVRKVWTAADAIKDTEVCAYLVKNKSNVIEKV